MKLKYKILIIVFIMLLLSIKINEYKNFKFEKLYIHSRIDQNIFTEKLNIENSLIKIYSDLYDLARKGNIKPKISKKNVDYSKKKNYNISICSIGKNENLYIKEFVEYYKNIGLDKIYLFDNNDLEGEYFDKILNNYIKDKFVEIIDVRGLSSIQIPIYNYCYQKNKDKYDWIGFLDLDEYLYIKSNESIKIFFNNKRFDKCQTVFFNWVIFNDNDLIQYENRPLLDRFTKPTLKHSGGKSFVRGNINNLFIPSSHIIGINIKHICNSKGKIIYPKNYLMNAFEKNSIAYIKHFYSKTVEEFCHKINKGNAHFHRNHPQYKNILNN